MADIDEIISGARGNTRYDFAAIGDPVKSFRDAQKQADETNLRRAFKDGVPTDENGQPDFAAMSKTLFQKGGLDQGLAASNLDVSRQQLAAGQRDRALYAGGGTGQPAPVLPPSASRGASEPVAPPLNRGGAQPAGQPSQPQGGSVTLGQILTAQGIPNDQIGAASASLARHAELARLRFLAGSTDKGTAEAARAELKIRLEGQQPTTAMKEAAAMGIPLKESLDRTDENTTQRDILTKSIIPRIDTSQATATAARDDIDSIHRARAELDRPGGIINGAFADKRLFLAKAANLLGVPNAEKINNTEAYGAAIGQRVASMVKAFGSGTAISDGDRRFAAAMAGGNIELDEKSMRRILDIGEKAARGKIDYHNTFVDKVVNANEGLKSARDTFIVKTPDAYQKASDPYEKARAAIASGAPRDAVAQRLKQSGFDPGKL
jgi:hypothetical protein